MFRWNPKDHCFLSTWNNPEFIYLLYLFCSFYVAVISEIHVGSLVFFLTIWSTVTVHWDIIFHEIKLSYVKKKNNSKLIHLQPIIVSLRVRSHFLITTYNDWSKVKLECRYSYTEVYIDLIALDIFRHIQTLVTRIRLHNMWWNSSSFNNNYWLQTSLNQC